MSASQVTPTARTVRFPNPLAELRLAGMVEANGFTLNEMVALRNLVHVVKRHLSQHAFIVIINFFAVNENLLLRFCTAGKFDLQKLNVHARRFLPLYVAIIEKALDDRKRLLKMLRRTAAVHLSAGVQKEEIALLTNVIKTYFLHVMQPISSPTLVVALDKMSKVIISSYDADYTCEVIRKSRRIL